MEGTYTHFCTVCLYLLGGVLMYQVRDLIDGGDQAMYFICNLFFMLLQLRRHQPGSLEQFCCSVQFDMCA